MERFQQASYDCLNPEETKFDEDFADYEAKRRDWSHRLGSVVVSAATVEDVIGGR